jgi:hypothetical protein
MQMKRDGASVRERGSRKHSDNFSYNNRWKGDVYARAFSGSSIKAEKLEISTENVRLRLQMRISTNTRTQKTDNDVWGEPSLSFQAANTRGKRAVLVQGKMKM